MACAAAAGACLILCAFALLERADFDVRPWKDAPFALGIHTGPAPVAWVYPSDVCDDLTLVELEPLASLLALDRKLPARHRPPVGDYATQGHL